MSVQNPGITIDHWQYFLAYLTQSAQSNPQKVIIWPRARRYSLLNYCFTWSPPTFASCQLTLCPTFHLIWSNKINTRATLLRQINVSLGPHLPLEASLLQVTPILPRFWEFVEWQVATQQTLPLATPSLSYDHMMIWYHHIYDDLISSYTYMVTI